jgi:hypothetical protein
MEVRSPEFSPFVFNISSIPTAAAAAAQIMRCVV